MKTAAIYARFSSDNQRDASIEDQLRLCTERAEREGWNVVQSYSDQGISGASLLRPGIQNLIEDAQAGKFDIVLAEALDRISRDQEDIAGLYKRLSFAGISILTLSEGEVSELHVGLKGTMNALFLKDLADKTRRGLRGRVEKGKSGGGKSYGYDVVRNIKDGELERGGRKINTIEAGIITRIFTDYAGGISPRSIAHALNKEGIPGPTGKSWGPSTIHGHRGRGTGILNNEMYIGRLVWNKLRYMKNPDTGKRISKLNPRAEWIIKEVPELRILDDDLWQKAKARQAKLDAKPTGMWDCRRPRYLFSGLMRCGVCGGGAVVWNRAYIGCANARNKGTCDNKTTIKRDELEQLVLDGLQHRLMNPELTELFCQEFTREINRLRKEQNGELASQRTELAKITRELDRLVQALMDGVSSHSVKDRIHNLELRKRHLEANLENASEEQVLLHPSMADVYRKKVVNLRETLSVPDRQSKAAELLRSAIDYIELYPVEENGKARLNANLHGDLAGILSLAMNGSAQKKRTPPDLSDVPEMCTKLVAGAGFEPATFRL
tara:strand:+ start:1457 stop:3112 length:1656 start_codon:yes stop_codon:yes gene_type:complete